MGNKPIENFHAGNIEVAVWENSGEELKIFHTVTAKRSYRDGNGDWKETGSINVLSHQLPDLILALQESQRFLRMGLRQRRSQTAGEQQETLKGLGDQQVADSQTEPVESTGVARDDPPKKFTEKVNQSRSRRAR